MKIDNRIIIGIFALIFCVSLAHGLYIGNIYFDGENATGGNLFITADIHLHTAFTQAIGGAGTWYNMSFLHNGNTLKHNILHTHDDNTNDTITIVYDGVYDFKYAANFNNTGANPDDYAILRIIVNGVEHNSSGMGSPMTRENRHVVVSGCTRIELNAGDEVKLQFTSTSTDTNLEAQSDIYLDHYDSARICLVRIR